MNLSIVSAQILFLWLIGKLGYFMAEFWELPIPGSVLGLLFLFVLLLAEIVPLSAVERGASLLLRHMALFFIPIAVGMMSFGELFIENGLVILLALLVSTAIGFFITGTVTQRLIAREESHVRAGSDRHL